MGIIVRLDLPGSRLVKRGTKGVFPNGIRARNRIGAVSNSADKA